MNNTDLTNYTSPFSWRYGSLAMRRIFSEENKYKIWRRIWVELARAQHTFGLVSKEELIDLESHQDDLNIERIWEIEKDTRHDVVAAIQEFAEKAKLGGGKIHLGATSMDINDNAETIRVMEALAIIEKELIELIKTFAKKIEKYADFVCMGYTHLQPAEPTTLGYRFAFYAQDLLMDFELLQFVKKNLKGKGMKGAVGTSAGYVKLLDLDKALEMDKMVIEKLGIDEIDIASQTYPRKIDLFVANVLASIAESLNKFAFDLRIMQSPGFGEWSEGFGKSQVGSSAMPFKRNPIKAEQICSLARLIVNLGRISWDNAAHMGLERTLDDSANRRVAVPEMFLGLDEMLTSAKTLIEDLTIIDKRITTNLETYWPFAVSEGIIIDAVKNGADRQKMHDLLRGISMKAWEQIQDGEDNPMESLLMQSQELNKYLKPEDIRKLLDAKNHIGNAKQKALALADKINKL